MNDAIRKLKVWEGINQQESWVDKLKNQEMGDEEADALMNQWSRALY